MLGGGHLRSYRVDNQGQINGVVQGFAGLAGTGLGDLKGSEHRGTLLAVGDGNHSLCAAKDVWDEMKPSLSDSERGGHPARFALIEMVNLHSEGVRFEPIHRIVYSPDPARLYRVFVERLGGTPQRAADSRASLEAASRDGDRESIACMTSEEATVVRLPPGEEGLPVAVAQSLLDELVQSDGGTIDYIHGDEALVGLSRRRDAFCVYLPAIQKSEFFPLLDRTGVFPRKTFSMGEPQEKRYYFEARMLLPME